MSRTIIRTTGEGPMLEIGPTRNWIKLSAEESGGLVGAVEMELGPGFPGPPEHRHMKIDHLWYALGGRIDIIVGGERFGLDPGDFAFVPRGIAHAFSNLGTAPARLLQVDTPRTLDAYFTELATAIPSGAPVDPTVVGDIQRRHDTIPLTAR
jgi:mannose-6-phosphate isomerase-like protein (cupin superfamily)